MATRDDKIVVYEQDGETRRYNKSFKMSKEEQWDLYKECFDISCSKDLNKDKKKAARIVMGLINGKRNTSKNLEGVAVVTNKNDTLVRWWRKDVIKRDKVCQDCGAKDNLHAHHISRWADDPVNRINIDNGIALCPECHSNHHKEIKKLILSNRKSKDN